jgi:hypothetical protein
MTSGPRGLPSSGGFGMKRELGELHLQAVLVLKFLDTPGDEIAPGSNEVGENFEHQRIGHKASYS